MKLFIAIDMAAFICVVCTNKPPRPFGNYTRLIQVNRRMLNDQVSNKKAVAKFIQSAKEFEKSEIECIRQNSKIAWWITSVCLLIMRLSVGAIVGLTHKTMIPFVIRVDNNKGLTDIVKQLKTSEKSYGR